MLIIASPQIVGLTLINFTAWGCGQRPGRGEPYCRGGQAQRPQVRGTRRGLSGMPLPIAASGPAVPSLVGRRVGLRGGSYSIAAVGRIDEYRDRECAASTIIRCAKTRARARSQHACGVPPFTAAVRGLAIALLKWGPWRGGAPAAESCGYVHARVPPAYRRPRTCGYVYWRTGRKVWPKLSSRRAPRLVTV